MLALSLPAISSSANPEFTSSQGCADWLQTLPLINVGPSHGRLLGELEELNRCDVPVSERIKILEALLEPVQFVQSEHAKKFSSRAVPLAKTEREILLSVTALWTALGIGYQHCLGSLATMAPGLLSGSVQLSLVCQRAMWCASQVLQEHHKCYLDIGAQSWKLLHSLYAFAEERNLLRDPVDHPVVKVGDKTSIMDTYAQALLLNVANPNEQTSRQLLVTARWLEQWGRKIMVSADRPELRDGASILRPLTIDLSNARGAMRTDPGKDENSYRYLDVSELSNSIRKRIVLLRKGDRPSFLGLGDDVAPQFAEQLLIFLHRQWCEDRQPRIQTRKSATAKAALATGMASLHYHVTGQPFRQPSSSGELSKSQREEIATFGRIATRDEDDFGRVQILALESWQIADESLSGLRLVRISGEGRFVHTQLVAVRPADSKSYLLCTMRWLAVDADYAAKIGVRLIPGIPHGISIRATGLNAASDKYVPALSLSAVPALKSPESLILPVGWYKPQRVIEAFSDQSRLFRLTGVLDRGTDFERVSFDPA